MNQKLKEILVSISFSHLSQRIILSFVNFLRSIMIFTIGYQFNTFMRGLWKTTARTLILVSSAYPWRVFCFHETCLTFYNYEFFPLLGFFFMYVFFYMHIVLEVRNSSESRALAHSHLISRQSTLAQKDSFTNLLAQRACVPCMSTNVF